MEQQTHKPKRRVLKSLAVLITAAVIFTAGFGLGRLDSSASPNRTAFDYNSVEQLYGLLEKNFDGSLDRKELLDGIKSGLVSAAGDPYTEYFNPEEAEDFNSGLRGSFTGIGAELGADAKGNIVIVAPLAGYPAEKAGLKPKDQIAAVNGESTSGLNVGEAVRKIRGPADTKVTLTIVRTGTQAFDVTITRAKITVPSVTYEVDGDIGYLKISQFTEGTVELVNNAAREFKAKRIKGIVLDLRSNPGGYLDTSVAVASLWLDNGKTVVSERRGSAVLSTKYSRGSHPFKGLPTVALINEGSASAAEIMAGALRDNGAATLVGAKTFGKGSVQQVENLPDGAELKVTIARWYTPNGKNIDKQGITPDVAVKISDADQEAERDTQKDKAYEILRSKVQ